MTWNGKKPGFSSPVVPADTVAASPPYSKRRAPNYGSPDATRQNWRKRLEQSDEEIIRTIETNLTGALLGCRRAAAVMMRRKRGTIINIASVCALYAWPAWSVYTAAKAGLAKFSHGLYTELRPWGIRVSCVYPSWGQTDFNHAAGIRGAAEDPKLAARCISPEALGKLIRSILEQPDYLAVPDVTLQPVIQEISPM